MFRVLSIDFDYFQDVDMHTVKNYYPDGIDLPTEVTAVIWSTKYNKHYIGYDGIQKVKANAKLIRQIKDLMLMQDDIPVVIRQSHLGIWEAIENRCTRGQDIYVSHIDFHDDLTNGNEKRGIVDCGNWLYFLTHLYHTKMIWYTRKTSTECYGIEKDELPIFVDDLSHLLRTRQKYDLIFLCRSDPWIPPHLDKDFDDLLDFCECNFIDVDVQDSVKKPRDMDLIQEMARQVDECYEKLMTGGGI